MSIAAMPATLPLPLSPLVGRDQLPRVLHERLTIRETRLLTLTGPGGVGKTRLAIQAAIDISREFAGHVVFVDLAPIADPALVLPTIAQALGLQESGTRPLRDLVASCLEPTPTLLVLDNFEHVLSAASVVADLLRSCGQVTVLATSRAPLHISGEIEIPIPPLTAPGDGTLPPIGELSGFGAVQLFLDRVRAAEPAFTLTTENAAAVAEICRRLDGLPLALELAAPWAKTLSLNALLARLERRLPLLTGGPRDHPARLRTMRDAIAWSYGLLALSEQDLFRTLAVFVGGVSLEAATAVSREGGEAGSLKETSSLLDPSSSIVLDSLAALIDHSLLRREASADGEPRFVMLEMIREFGIEQLNAADEWDEMRARHATYFLHLAETTAPRLKGPEQGRWLDFLESDHANLRAAMDWFEETGDTEAALRLAGALFRFWWVRGHLSEGRGWYARLLASATSQVVAPVIRARALTSAGALAQLQRDLDRAMTLLADGLGWARQAGDPREIADALNALGSVSLDRGDLDRAGAWYQEAIPYYRAADHPEGMAGCLNNLSLVWRERGDLAGAEKLLDEARTVFQARGDRRGVGISLNNLGMVATLRGELAASAAFHRDGLTIRQELGDQTGLTNTLDHIGHLASAAGRHADAVRLLAAAAVSRRRIDVAIRSDAQGHVDRTLAAARLALDPAAFAAAAEAGATLSIDQALTDAWRVITPPTEPESEPTPPAIAGLTQREIEVLHLLAAGLTDREIGESLFISPATATRHVANIYRKIGVHSRAEATAFARNHGLA